MLIIRRALGSGRVGSCTAHDPEIALQLLTMMGVDQIEGPTFNNFAWPLAQCMFIHDFCNFIFSVNVQVENIETKQATSIAFQ